jgi:putative transposase
VGGDGAAVAGAAGASVGLDKGYDYSGVYELLTEFGFKHELAFAPAAGVVERTHSWLNRFRRLLVRWEKQPRTYIAMLHLACGLITWREALKNPLPK